MVVYAFEYCGCIYESGYSCISLHRTKKGAYKAMRRFLLEKWGEYMCMDKYYDKLRRHKFMCHERVTVTALTLEE